MLVQLLIGIIIGILWYYWRKEKRDRLNAERERELFEKGYRAAQEYRGEGADMVPPPEIYRWK